MDKNKLFIASFDIGKKNFAFCIEEIDKDKLIKIDNIEVKERYNIDGTPTEKMVKLLEEIYGSGEMILYENVDITKNCDPKSKLDPETFHNMTDCLDKFIEYWDKCSLIIIEEQMSFGKKLNKMAMKLGQHCYSYFAFKYGRFKQIIEFPAYYKTQILGAPKIEGKPYKSGKKRFKAMEKPQRKKWSIKNALSILELRGKNDIIQELKKRKKLDDIGDCLNQLQAAKYKIFIDKSL